MIRSTFVAAAAALLFTTPMALAAGGTWICENPLDMDQDEARAIAGGNGGLYQILMKTRENWDIAHKREQCQAYAEGRDYEISCLDGRRDWDEIKAMVPEEYFGMASADLTPHFQAIQNNTDESLAAADYCRDVGATK